MKNPQDGSRTRTVPPERPRRCGPVYSVMVPPVHRDMVVSREFGEQQRIQSKLRTTQTLAIPGRLRSKDELRKPVESSYGRRDLLLLVQSLCVRYGTY